ncbi:MAG: YjbQ family protein [Parcubacteria group bacterium]|nr:YjbQ family protein [Parcubacteria group bacterium]
MAHHFDKLTIRTAGMLPTSVPNIRLYDITKNITGVVLASKIKHGIVVAQSLHTTAGLLVNENEDGLLQNDFPNLLVSLCPEGTYTHDRPERLATLTNEPVNGVSHLRAALGLLPSVTLIVKHSVVQLGTWQALLFVDCDPVHREERFVDVLVLGEA